MVVVVVIEAVREWRSEMIWRQRDLEPAGAEAAAADATAAKIEARGHDGRAEIAAAWRKAEGTRGGGGGGGGGRCVGGGGRGNAGHKKPKTGAAAVAAVADRFVRELVL